MRFATPWRAEGDRPDRQSRRRRTTPRAEPLEGRALLSRGGHPPFPVSTPPPRPFPLLQPTVVGSRPLDETIADGYVKKAPQFYQEYTGPNLDELNAVAATGQIKPGVGFVFTGTVVGPIDPTLPAHFVFAVNRGGAYEPGPYPRRPHQTFDAAIDVQTGPAGPTTSVLLFSDDHPAATVQAPAQTPLPINGLAVFQLQAPPSTVPTSVMELPPQDVSIVGNQVRVVVPLAMLPPTTPPNNRHIDPQFLSEYHFTFSPRLSLNDPNLIASFVPEYIGAPVSPPPSQDPHPFRG